MPAMQHFDSVPGMLRALKPAEPVYCIYPRIYRESTTRFLDGFPGRVLYAVKANKECAVLQALADCGVRHFDCASLAEIRDVRGLFPDAACYFMNPVRLRGAARAAHEQYGVRHFIVDHASGLHPLLEEIDAEKSVVFARMAVHHESAMAHLSTKYGAEPEDMPALLTAIRDSGAEPALAFNVGSGVLDPAAYVHSVEVAKRVLGELSFRLRLVDIGGGFPQAYPGFDVPPLDEYFAAIRDAAAGLPLADGGELLAEPGRALSAPGVSAVVEILLQKGDRLYVNDGMYGAFWELRFKGHKQYPRRVFRDGKLLTGELRPFTLFGPSCDSGDVLPAPVELPADIEVGDYIEFGAIGAYSLSGRTDFNGFYSETIVRIDSDTARPPA